MFWLWMAFSLLMHGCSTPFDEETEDTSDSVGSDAGSDSGADSDADADTDNDVDADSDNDTDTDTDTDTDAEKQPNLIIILSDDQGYADLYENLPPNLQRQSKYDEVKIATPNLDKLARSGIIFTDAHSNGNTCAPSRAGIMLGRYEQRAGLWDTPDSRVGLDLEEVTLADVLKKGGYTTGIFGKWHLGLAPMYNPRQRGFDSFYGFMGHGAHDYYDLTIEGPIYHNNIMRDYENIDEGNDQYLTDRIAEETVDFIEQNRDKPFFAYVCFNAVHTPMQPPRDGPFATDSSVPREQLMGMLGRMDLAIKSILDALASNGIRKDTLVVFMSDNGGASASDADNSPLKGNKGTMWEGGIRVPFFVSWPGTLAAGEQFEEMIMGFDIFPTFVAAAGLSMPDNGKEYDGVNLLPFLPDVHGESRKQGAVHKSLFWDQNQGPYAVRVGDWKLVKQTGGVELYNMAVDHVEKNDLSSTRADKVSELKAAYRAWKSEMKPQYESKSGCRDPRYEEYSEVLVRHNEDRCLTLIPKDGCRDPLALNFDIAVTNHIDSECKY